MNLQLVIVSLLGFVQLCVCDLTCAGGGHRACDWSCRIRGREGRCSWDEVEEKFSCDCFGDTDTELDLFGDKEDGEGLKKGSLPYFLKQVVFLPLVRSYFFRSRDNLPTPSKYGLENGENFYIATENGTLGAWYLWPANNPYTPITRLKDNSTLIVYMHGNSMDRGFSHRVQLYKVLTSMGYHLVTFDYRSYGDSSRVELSEETVVDDGKAVLSWVAELYKLRSSGGPNLSGLAKSNSPSRGPNIIVWGHSLGTAVAARAVSELEGEMEISGIVLESPFNKMEEEVRQFKVASWTAWAMGIDIGELLSKAGVQFLTEDYLPQIQAPTLVLHSDDDPIVPSYLGEKLVNTTIKRGKKNIELVRFGKEHRLRHRYIYRAPGVQNILEKFVKKTEQFRKKMIE